MYITIYFLLVRTEVYNLKMGIFVVFCFLYNGFHKSKNAQTLGVKIYRGKSFPQMPLFVNYICNEE